MLIVRKWFKKIVYFIMLKNNIYKLIGMWIILKNYTKILNVCIVSKEVFPLPDEWSSEKSKLWAFYTDVFPKTAPASAQLPANGAICSLVKMAVSSAAREVRKAWYAPIMLEIQIIASAIHAGNLRIDTSIRRMQLIT